MNVSDNTPSTGYISWSNVKISYKGQTYTIADGNTNYIYVYWLYSDPTSFYGSNVYPDLTDDDILVFVNKNGVHLTVPNTTILDGSLFVPESIVANALAANSITAEKIVAGAISADKIAANAIGADKLAVNNLAAISANLGTVNAGVLDISQGLSIANDNVTIDSNGINVKNGAFTLEEDNTNVRFDVSPARNLIKDHSFELLISDPDSLNQDSVTHNWLEIKEYPDANISFWQKVGSPKVTVQYAPDSPSALAIFGEHGAVIANANYLRQYAYEGIAANGIYTLSAYFKRQWQCTAGGTPYLEVWELNAAGTRILRLASAIFDPVPDDYSVVRRAVTFTVPSDYQEDYSLEVIVSNGQLGPKWIQCDGVQLVEGTIPSVYQPEDSVWKVTSGDYRSILKWKSLWSGVVYPTDQQTIYPDIDIDQCQNGWMLEWQAYESGVGVKGIQYSYDLIPKHMVILNSGKSYSLLVPYNASTNVFKYLFFYNDHIVGHAQNNTSPNNNKVLTAVYEW